MGEKVFEIYREQVTEYQDRIFLKRDKIIKDMASSCVVNEEKCVTEQIPICSSVFTGQQFVAIEGANIIETCNGGLLKWIYGETRVLCRSVHTLIAIRSEDNRL